MKFYSIELLQSTQPKHIRELDENIPTVIDISEDSQITVTAFSWTEEKEEPKLIFLISGIYFKFIHTRNVVFTNFLFLHSSR